MAGLINYIIRHHCLSVTDKNHFYVAQFMRESISKRDTVGCHGCSNLLSRSEISCIIQYLATYGLLRPYWLFLIFSFLLFYCSVVLRVQFHCNNNTRSSLLQTVIA